LRQSKENFGAGDVIAILFINGKSAELAKQETGVEKTKDNMPEW